MPEHFTPGIAALNPGLIADNPLGCPEILARNNAGALSMNLVGPTCRSAGGRRRIAEAAQQRGPTGFIVPIHVRFWNWRLSMNFRKAEAS